MAIPDLSHAAQLGFQTGRASAPGNSMGMFIKGLLEHKEKIAETNQKFKQEIAGTLVKQQLEEASPKYQAQTEASLASADLSRASAEKKRMNPFGDVTDLQKQLRLINNEAYRRAYKEVGGSSFMGLKKEQVAKLSKLKNEKYRSMLKELNLPYMFPPDDDEIIDEESEFNPNSMVF